VQQIPGQRQANTTSLQGTIRDAQTTLAIPGVKITLLRAGTVIAEKLTDAEGIFRLLGLAPGIYELRAEKPGFQVLDVSDIQIRGAETEELVLEPIAGAALPTKGPTGVPGVAPSPPTPAPSTTGSYPGLRTAQTPSSPRPLGIAPEQVPPDSANFVKQPDRWSVPMPTWDRYGRGGEFPYTKGHWYDPFNRSRLKGDQPIFGQKWAGRP